MADKVIIFYFTFPCKAFATGVEMKYYLGLF